MRRQNGKSSKGTTSKRSALHPITNSDISHRAKVRKVGKVSDNVESSDAPAFPGGVLCELRLSCQRDGSSEESDAWFASIDGVQYADSYGTPTDVTIRGRDARGVIREAHVRYSPTCVCSAHVRLP